MEKFYSIKEVSYLLRVHPNTVRGWIERNLLETHRFGRLIRIYESDLQAFLNRDGNDQR